ncbi:MAG: hypothetical protein IPL87_00685 [Candidatus Moraniibacteriota bacterium]|nr:MAG: hypothetical protein IPL87_00685 [Candidatus Moranbacteria bacterium]
MKKVLLATHNRSKFERYRKILKAIPDLEVVSLFDVGITEKVEENYATNRENAEHKAQSYGKISGLITIAIDDSLMTNFLPESEQPGVYARRFAKDKKELTDLELIAVWKKIFDRYPQEEKKFIWNFAIAFYNPSNGSLGGVSLEEIDYLAQYFSSIETNGYPLSALLSSTKDGIPYIEMSQEEKEIIESESFLPFVKDFQRWLRFAAE